MEQEYTRAYLADDGSGHTYLIPYDLTEHFAERLEEAEDNDDVDMSEQEYLESYTYEDFEEEFEDYRVEGDYEIYAKF